MSGQSLGGEGLWRDFERNINSAQPLAPVKLNTFHILKTPFDVLEALIDTHEKKPLDTAQFQSALEFLSRLIDGSVSPADLADLSYEQDGDGMLSVHLIPES